MYVHVQIHTGHTTFCTPTPNPECFHLEHISLFKYIMFSTYVHTYLHRSAPLIITPFYGGGGGLEKNPLSTYDLQPLLGHKPARPWFLFICMYDTSTSTNIRMYVASCTDRYFCVTNLLYCRVCTIHTVQLTT